MPIRETNEHRDSQELGLQALVWVVSDGDRADRLLSMTGLDAGELRARASDPALLAAVLGFVEAHEPDLVACAAALDLPPPALIDARRRLEKP
jgi:hypothetical protein